MAEDRRSYRPGEKADGVNTKGLQRADERIGLRKIESRKYKAGYAAVQEEVIPFDRRPHCGSQHRAAELPLVRGIVKSAALGGGDHRASIHERFWPALACRKLTARGSKTFFTHAEWDPTKA